MKVREVLDRLRATGWLLARPKGSHRQFVHPARLGARVTGAGKPWLDIPRGTLNRILKQAGWK
jgi:predicted RNA binding protein YcfA (HicA-like mRNA interferase family)